jgi:hypothetical protein
LVAANPYHYARFRLVLSGAVSRDHRS